MSTLNYQHQRPRSPAAAVLEEADVQAGDVVAVPLGAGGEHRPDEALVAGDEQADDEPPRLTPAAAPNRAMTALDPTRVPGQGAP